MKKNRSISSLLIKNNNLEVVHYEPSCNLMYYVKMCYIRLLFEAIYCVKSLDLLIILY